MWFPSCQPSLGAASVLSICRSLVRQPAETIAEDLVPMFCTKTPNYAGLGEIVISS